MWSRHWVSTWIVTSWPPETEEILRYQWKAAVPVWKALAARARDHGVKRIALEFHGWQLVYNVETLRRLRSEVGDDILGVNLDPSHLFWMGADPVEVARALADCIYHVHIKFELFFGPFRFQHNNGLPDLLIQAVPVLAGLDRLMLNFGQ